MTARNPTTTDIDWFNDLLAFKRLDLDPVYQRYSVWSKGYKQYFIDTILGNFPCPSIFLHKENISSTEHIYHVVDGKQRLLAIFGFQNNEFPLARDHDEFPGKYWADLPPEVQTRFGNYQISVEILTTNNRSYLKDVFDRLNRNVRRLNEQELRHARHEGPFIKLVETLAKERFWKDIGLSTPARIRNMRDTEYVSEIFLLTVHGVLDGGSRILDDYYAEYDDEESFQDIEECQGIYEECQEIMKRLDTSFLRSTRFNNLHDFYSLWAALLEYVKVADEIDYETTRVELAAFTERVTDPDNIASDDEVALKYSDAVRQGANKRANRQLRADILKDLIKTK
ncbi:DUF262 domain-containing protein [Acidovorax sp.]|uniref:DUF262 domain-containing protein n=1 Tax=Acidovorax sp. TaxID=1872122 RepID=UPI0025C56E1A|nr:DUF262 domain-containing protein [Acidovorax sp.]MBL7091656.1 DUF262 domain-containing protein [Acidovorax sp.]